MINQVADGEGTPRLRWVGSVERDLRTTRVKSWRNIAEDRDERQRTTREARARATHYDEMKVTASTGTE
jgi:hypothetical protein